MNGMSRLWNALAHGVGAGWPRLRGSSFVRGLAILTSASLLQTLVTLASAPIVSRLFSPAAFGVAGLIQALEVVPVLLATGQYYFALGIARSRSEAVNVVFLSIFLIPLCTLLALPIALYLVENPHLLPASLATAAPYIWVIPATMIALNVLAITRSWEIRHAHYGPQVVNRLIEGGGIAASQIGFGLLGAGPLGLIAGRWLGTSAAAVDGLRRVLGQIGWRGLRTISLRRMRVLAVRHWRFPLYNLPASILGGLSQQLVPILLGLFYSVDSVGFYWFANRLLERPAIVWGANVGRVYYQHAADSLKERRPVAKLFFRSTGVLAATAIIPFGAIILFGPLLFGLVFGAEWEEAGEYARWIAFANFTFLVGFPARVASGLFQLQRTYILFEVFRIIATVSSMIGVAHFGGSEFLAISATATAQGVTTLSYIGVVGAVMVRLDRRVADVHGSSPNT